VEINHNATDKTLEISCKIFTDDFEKVLAQNYKTKVDLTNPPDRKAMDSVVKKYIFFPIFQFLLMENQEHFPISVLKKMNEAVYSYVQVEMFPQ
jgi:hypothetical protein